MIAAKYSESGSVLSSISDNESMLADLAELDGATNDRLLGRKVCCPGISVHELVYGVRYASIVNAAFTHKNPAGSRFNDGTRGAWYAGVERATSIAEVAYHRAQQLANIDWKEEERSTYDDYLADFTTEFHDLRGADREGTAASIQKVSEARASSGLLRRIATAGANTARFQVEWIDLSQRSQSWRHLRSVFSAAARLPCTTRCAHRTPPSGGWRFSSNPHKESSDS